jgi:hypothetical protein
MEARILKKAVLAIVGVMIYGFSYETTRSAPLLFGASVSPVDLLLTGSVSCIHLMLIKEWRQCS